MEVSISEPGGRYLGSFDPVGEVTLWADPATTFELRATGRHGEQAVRRVQVTRQDDQR